MGGSNRPARDFLQPGCLRCLSAARTAVLLAAWPLLHETSATAGVMHAGAVFGVLGYREGPHGRDPRLGSGCPPARTAVMKSCSTVHRVSRPAGSSDVCSSSSSRRAPRIWSVMKLNCSVPDRPIDPSLSPRCLIPVELRGFEPLTPTLPVWCATNCAIAPRSCANRSYTTGHCPSKLLVRRHRARPRAVRIPAPAVFPVTPPNRRPRSPAQSR